MPIKIDEFENGKEPSNEPRGATVWPKIEKFMQANLETAYRPTEIADELDLIPATVNNTMNKKFKDGVLDKKSYEGHVYYRYLGEEAAAEAASEEPEEDAEEEAEESDDNEASEEEEYEEEED